jgi:hypothetical protein
MKPRGRRLSPAVRKWLDQPRPVPRPESGRAPDPFPNLLATAEGCADVARQVLAADKDLPRGVRHQIVLDMVQNAFDFGYYPPPELMKLLRDLLPVTPKRQGVSAKPEFQASLALKRAHPEISIRALAEEVGVPWPTLARWQRTDYWKLAVSNLIDIA